MDNFVPNLEIGNEKGLEFGSSDRILALHGPRKELLIFEALEKEG